MTLGFIFWFLILLQVIAGVYTGWVAPDKRFYGFMGSSLLFFILLCLLGWKVFGFPIQG